MYTLLSGFYRYMFQKDEYAAVILGLDNAGKSVPLMRILLLQRFPFSFVLTNIMIWDLICWYSLADISGANENHIQSAVPRRRPAQNNSHYRPQQYFFPPFTSHFSSSPLHFLSSSSLEPLNFLMEVLQLKISSLLPNYFHEHSKR